jgi:hypothetical protein
MANYAYTFTSGDTVTPTKLNNARTVSNIANADISATAAIAGTKIAPNFGSQNVTTTGVVRLNGAAAGSFGAVSTSAGSPQLRLINNGSNTNVASVVMSKSRADNLVDDADPLGIIAFQGHDGTNYQSTAAISAFGDGTATSTSLPTAINFSTAATGSVSTAERMRITSAGNVGIGTASPSAAALLDVASTTRGFLPPRMTTAQRDAISTPPAGLMIYNSSTNKLQVRTNTAWTDLH